MAPAPETEACVFSVAPSSMETGGVILAGIAGNSLSLKRHGRAGGDVGGGDGVNTLVIGGNGVLLGRKP